MTLTTWQDYAGSAGSAGAAVTAWKYEGTRGFLTNKVYQGTNGPGYTYTKAGRLGTRTWARGITTTYAYNNAGELQGADYSDGTPDVSYAYDRQGRPARITGATTNDFTFTAAGLLLSENVVNKTWNYASQNRLGYDALQRRSGLTNLSLGLTHTYAYDAASRLQRLRPPVQARAGRGLRRRRAGLCGPAGGCPGRTIPFLPARGIHRPAPLP